MKTFPGARFVRAEMRFGHNLNVQQEGTSRISSAAVGVLRGLPARLFSWTSAGRAEGQSTQGQCASKQRASVEQYF